MPAQSYLYPCSLVQLHCMWIKSKITSTWTCTVICRPGLLKHHGRIWCQAAGGCGIFRLGVLSCQSPQNVRCVEYIVRSLFYYSIETRPSTYWEIVNFQLDVSKHARSFSRSFEPVAIVRLNYFLDDSDVDHVDRFIEGRTSDRDVSHAIDSIQSFIINTRIVYQCDDFLPIFYADGTSSYALEEICIFHWRQLYNMHRKLLLARIECIDEFDSDRTTSPMIRLTHTTLTKLRIYFLSFLSRFFIGVY
jgi:hypothetical protein